MSEAGSTTHIELFNQNIATNNISTNLISKFKLPALVISADTLRASDLEQLRDNLILKGDSYLYIKFKSQIVCIGKVDLNIDKFCIIKNAISSAHIFSIKNTTDTPVEITLEDMECTVTLCSKQIRENPDMHKGFIVSHWKDYIDLIYNNRELFKDSIENSDELQTAIIEYADKAV